MSTAFVVGAWGWWLGIAVIAAISIWAMFTEMYGGSYAAIVVFFVLCAFWGDVNIFADIIQHPMWIIPAVIMYFVVGFIWSFGRYTLTLLKIRTTSRDIWEKYKREHPELKTKEELVAGLEKQLSWTVPEIPTFGVSLTTAVNALLFWPLSMIHTFFDDVLKDGLIKFAEWIVKTYTEMYRSIYKRILGDLLAEMGQERKQLD